MSTTESGPRAPVSPAEGLPLWSDVAWDVLVETASQYGEVITYADLAERTQERSGVTTAALQHHWIGKLLKVLAERSQAQDLPHLTSLVVRKDDGEVGKGYDVVLSLRGMTPFEDVMDRENHAAAERLACYRHWAGDVPANARPQLSPRLRDRVAASRPKEPRRGTPCPSCFVEMPMNSVCVSCAS